MGNVRYTDDIGRNKQELANRRRTMFIVMWQNETGSDMIEEVETMEDAKAAAAKYYSDNDREDVKDDTVVVFANTPGTEDFQYPEPIETWSIEDFE